MEKEKKLKKIRVSTVDPDSGLFHKNDKERCLAYSAHTACDCRGYIVGTKVTAGNIHDSVMFSPLVESIVNHPSIGKPTHIAADAGYKTPFNCKFLFDQDIMPVLPYTRPKGNKGEMFRPTEFIYDEYYNSYICPNDETLEFVRIDTDGYKLYRSNAYKCKECKDLKKCTTSRNYEKIISRHIWKEYLEEADHLRHTSDFKMIYKARKETIERAFADCKEKHAMRYTHLRGLSKVKEEILLTFACLNLKKMIKGLIRKGKLKLTFFRFRSKTRPKDIQKQINLKFSLKTSGLSSV